MINWLRRPAVLLAICTISLLISLFNIVVIWPGTERSIQDSQRIAVLVAESMVEESSGKVNQPTRAAIGQVERDSITRNKALFNDVQEAISQQNAEVQALLDSRNVWVSDQIEGNIGRVNALLNSTRG